MRPDDRACATTRPGTAERQREAEAGRLRSRAVCCVEKVAGDLGARYAPERASLDTFTLYDDKQRPVVERLRALVDRTEGFTRSAPGLVFFGAIGTGKDHLLAAMLHAAARRGVACRWVNGQELFGQFRDRIDASQREEDVLAALCEPDILGVSDPIPPTADPSPWNLTQLYRVLDRRYRAMKPTWATFNAFSEADADAKLSAPVFDRLRDGAELFRCFWPSYREERR